VAFRAAGCGLPVCPPVWASVPVAGSDTGSGVIQENGPVVSGDKVYFASIDLQNPDGKTGNVYAYASSSCASTTNLNCTPLWVAHPAPFSTIEQNLTVANGFLYGAGADFLFAFDANGCGEPECGFLWFGGLGVNSGTSGSPSVAGGAVYYTQDTGRIGAFDAAGCGALACDPLFLTFTTQFDGFETTPVVLNGRLYVAGPGVGGRPTMWVYHLVK